MITFTEPRWLKTLIMPSVPTFISADTGEMKPGSALLVEASGLDADDNELTFPIGAVAIIDRIERLDSPHGIALTLAIKGK